MSFPSYQDRICAMFDSFAKIVSRNFARNLQIDEASRTEHYSDEPIDYFFELLGHNYVYPSESFVLYVDGNACVVESETLYKALLSLLKSLIYLHDG